MMIYEYRKKHPNCEYCHHNIPPSYSICGATHKRIGKRTAKKCPCYVPRRWKFELEGVMKNANDKS